MDLNLAPPVLLQDLNAPPVPEDPQEALFHPLDQGQEQVEVPIQQLAQEQGLEILEEIVDNINPPMDVQLPVLQALGENFLHHEIHEDELLDIEEGEMMEVDASQDQPFFQNNIQLGMVRTFFTSPNDLSDPRLAPTPKE